MLKCMGGQPAPTEEPNFDAVAHWPLVTVIPYSTLPGSVGEPPHNQKESELSVWDDGSCTGLETSLYDVPGVDTVRPKKGCS